MYLLLEPGIYVNQASLKGVVTVVKATSKLPRGWFVLLARFLVKVANTLSVVFHG